MRMVKPQTEFHLLGGTGDTGVAEHDVELTIIGDRWLDKILHLIFVCHIAVDEGAPVSANGRSHLVAKLVLNISDDHHTRPLVCEHTRRRFADAAGTAGDYGHFAR